MTEFRDDPVGSPDGGVIVVGVDGSEPSLLALRWAIRQARLTGAKLRAVTSWHLPNTAGWAPLPEGLDWEAGAREGLEAALRDALGGQTDVLVSTAVVEGRPAPVLIEASHGADLLVVGNRGHGEFAGMLLGSVSEHCVSQAHCPVVVVRPTD